MSTDSTEPADVGGARPAWLRRAVVPALVAVVLGAVGGGAFYYFNEYRKPSLHRTSPSAARGVASDHMLIAIRNDAGGSSAVAMIGRGRGAPRIVAIPSGLVVEVPGLGPRSAGLALRQAGAEAAAVAVANALRVKVPASLTANVPTAAGTVDDVGGVTVNVPRTLRSDAGGFMRTVFDAGAVRMTGDSFVRYMTGSFAGESAQDRDARQLAGWRALLLATTRPDAAQAMATWTSDIRPSAALALLHSCADAPADLSVATTPVGLAGEDLLRIDEGRLADTRRELADFSNGAETLDGRRIRLVVRASGGVGPIVGRILVNAGYVIEMSGKTATPAPVTRVAVAPTVFDAEATGKDIAALLGMGLVKVSTDSSADTDIILTIGMDWAEANGFPQR